MIKFIYVLIIFGFSISCQAKQSIDDIVNEIQQLEQKRDPKCYATASRLEDFMFGTPLSADARFDKNLLQKKWAKIIWSQASNLARKSNQSIVLTATLKQVLDKYILYQIDKNKHWRIEFPAGQVIRINGEDKRQYS